MKHLKWSALSFLLLITFSLQAHNLGTIKGVVTDFATGEPVSGAHVFIEKTMLGTVSDYNGAFEFRNIHEGSYTLVVTFVGYMPKSTSVRVEPDKTTELEMGLQAENVEIDSYSVVAQRPFSAASVSHIRNADLALRPNKSSQDLLKLAPGLITAQHAGGGKAEQIFIRGFDCDHGTDINISVDGLPVNMVSHGHGQGYADLHFLIPELVEEIDVYKGPYFAEFGNLATAGAIRFKTLDQLPSNLLKVEGGQFNTFKTTLLVQPGKGSAEQNGYLGLQYYTSDGPFESPMNLGRLNVFGKYFVNIGHSSRLTFTGSSFSSAWDASGQVPQRAITQGTITRFGSIDDLEGGNTSRSDFNILFEQKDENNNRFEVQAFASQYDFKLFSNFTFFLDDSINGDMIEQLDKRLVLGSNTRYTSCTRLGNVILKSSFGAGFRSDNIHVGLQKSPDRVRTDVLSDALISERNLSCWVIEEFVFSSNLRLQLGLRGDYFTFNVDDLVGTATEPSASGVPHASGYAQQGMLNPKLNLAYSPANKLELYLNAGSGFHSNDARNVVIGQQMLELEKAWSAEGLNQEQIDHNFDALNFDPEQSGATTLPRAIGGEVGLRTKFRNRIDVGLAAWYLYLEKEYVYVGDGGFTELSDPTERAGVDLEVRCRVFQWLWADADLCISQGRITGLPQGRNYIPLAPRITSSGGLTLKDFHGFEAALRYVYVDHRPANEDNSVVALGYLISTLGVQYHLHRFSFSATLENLFNALWNEAQFDTESRLQWETEPVSEIHFTPGNPRNIQLGLAYMF